MFWEDLSIKEKSDLMRLYISNGIMDLDSIKKHYNSFATGGTLPDHDPNNPYHYHDAEGNKVVISPEDWEANVGKPYFREIEAAVKAEQAAYPELEYEVNPAFMRDLNSSVAAARGQNGMINYAGYRNQLPQGYTINENGIIFDDKGQAYVQESYPQSTRFTYNTDSPLQFTFNQGKPIERNVNFYPVNMDMRVKEPLPVDRILDVNDERENAIKTIQDNLVYRTSLENILPGFEGGMMVGNTPLYYDFSSKNNHKEFIKKYLENITGTPVTFIKYNDDYDNIVELNKEQLDTITKNSKLYYDKLNAEQIEKIKKDLLKASPNDFRTKKEYDEHVDVDNKYIQSLSDYINSSDFYYDYPEDRPKPYKLSRKEAEKKAVISIDPLEKTKTFEEGGPVDNKSDWAKAHEKELALHQLGWDNPDNRLHSDYAAKDDNGYYAGFKLKPVTIKAEHPIRQWDKTISLDSPYLKDLYQHYLNREEAGKEYLNNIGRVGLTVGTLPLLGYGLAAAPLTTGLSVLGGEGLNYGVKKLTPYQSWGNLLAQGVFNTDNELAHTALEYTNPGFLLGPKAAPFVNSQYRGLRVANELRKSINNATKYGDIRVNETSFRDPTKFYRFVEQPEVNTIRELGFNVTSTDASRLGANISSNANRFRLNTLANKARQAKNNNTISIVKRGSAHGNVSQAAAGRPWQSSVAQSDGLFRRGLLEGNLDDGVLASTSSRSVFKPTQMSDLFSGQRIGFKTNTMPTENLRYFEDLGNGIFRYNGKVIPEKREYVLERDYNIAPTLEQAYQEAINNQQNNPVVFARSLADEGLDNVLRDNYLEGSPSFALTKYSNDNLDRLSELYANNKGITFLFGKGAAGNNAKYFVGDADTPIRQDAARALNLPATEEAINNITPEQVVLGKRMLHDEINSDPISFREAVNLTRENNFGNPDYFYNEVLLDKILDYKNAIGAIVNEDKPQYRKMLETLGIPYGSSLSDIPFNFKGFQNGGSLGHITPFGQWEYPNEVTTIPSNNITMKGVDYPVIGVSDTGDTKYMLPNMDYIFDGQYVTEYPINK